MVRKLTDGVLEPYLGQREAVRSNERLDIEYGLQRLKFMLKKPYLKFLTMPEEQSSVSPEVFDLYQKEGALWELAQEDFEDVHEQLMRTLKDTNHWDTLRRLSNTDGGSIVRAKVILDIQRLFLEDQYQDMLPEVNRWMDFLHRSSIEEDDTSDLRLIHKLLLSSPKEERYRHVVADFLAFYHKESAQKLWSFLSRMSEETTYRVLFVLLDYALPLDELHVLKDWNRDAFTMLDSLRFFSPPYEEKKTWVESLGHEVMHFNALFVNYSPSCRHVFQYLQTMEQVETFFLFLDMLEQHIPPLTTETLSLYDKLLEHRDPPNLLKSARASMKALVTLDPALVSACDGTPLLFMPELALPLVEHLKAKKSLIDFRTYKDDFLRVCTHDVTRYSLFFAYIERTASYSSEDVQLLFRHPVSEQEDVLKKILTRSHRDAERKEEQSSFLQASVLKHFVEESPTAEEYGDRVAYLLYAHLIGGEELTEDLWLKIVDRIESWSETRINRRKGTRFGLEPELQKEIALFILKHTKGLDWDKVQERVPILTLLIERLAGMSFHGTNSQDLPSILANGLSVQVRSVDLAPLVKLGRSSDVFSKVLSPYLVGGQDHRQLSTTDSPSLATFYAGLPEWLRITLDIHLHPTLEQAYAGYKEKVDTLLPPEFKDIFIETLGKAVDHYMDATPVLLAFRRESEHLKTWYYEELEGLESEEQYEKFLSQIVSPHLGGRLDHMVAPETIDFFHLPSYEKNLFREDYRCRDSVNTLLQANTLEVRSLIRELSNLIPHCFDQDAGVEEGYSVGEHTGMVLTQFEKYFKNTSMPCGLRVAEVRLMLALHDTGKPKALYCGDKEQQYMWTQSILTQVLPFLGLAPRVSNLIKAVLKDDLLGMYVQKKIPTHEAAKSIVQRAEGVSVSPMELYALMELYYKVDAGSYTQDAGGTSSLDFLFQFLEGQGIDFVPAIGDRIEELKAAITSVIGRG